MAKIQNKLSSATLEIVAPLVPKLLKETVGDVFTKDEIHTLEVMYFEMTGKPAGKGCGRMCAATLVLCQNYFKIHPIEEVEAPIFIPEIEDYSRFTFKELKGMFPYIKATSKTDFIKQIELL
jgi:hypothetical protein